MLYHRQCPENKLEAFSRYLIKESTRSTDDGVDQQRGKLELPGNSLHTGTLFKPNGFYLVLGERLVKIMENATQAGGAFNIIPLENLSASGMIQRINDWQGKSMRKIVYLILALGLVWLAKLSYDVAQYSQTIPQPTTSDQTQQRFMHC